MPKGTPVNKYTLITACKHLHLAFKGYEPAEIYNVLATILLRVIQKYDPFYVEKVKETVAVISRVRLPRFTIQQLNKQLGFNAQYIALACKLAVLLACCTAPAGLWVPAIVTKRSPQYQIQSAAGLRDLIGAGIAS